MEGPPDIDGRCSARDPEFARAVSGRACPGLEGRARQEGRNAVRSEREERFVCRREAHARRGQSHHGVLLGSSFPHRRSSRDRGDDPALGEGKDSFTKDPPNATLSAFNSDGQVTNVVVELKRPTLVGDKLTYDARVLQGKPPAKVDGASLFIDVIGMPLTPLSSPAPPAGRADGRSCISLRPTPTCSPVSASPTTSA